MCTPRELAHTSSLFISNFTPGKLERNNEGKKNTSTKWEKILPKVKVEKTNKQTNKQTEQNHKLCSKTSPNLKMDETFYF